MKVTSADSCKAGSVMMVPSITTAAWQNLRPPRLSVEFSPVAGRVVGRDCFNVVWALTMPGRCGTALLLRQVTFYEGDPPTSILRDMTQDHFGRNSFLSRERRSEE